MTHLPGRNLVCPSLPLQTILQGQELSSNEVTTDRCRADVSLMCWLSFLASWFYIWTKALATAASLRIDHEMNEPGRAASLFGRLYPSIFFFFSFEVSFYLWNSSWLLPFHPLFNVSSLQNKELALCGQLLKSI